MLAVLRLQFLGHYFLKLGDLADISVSKVLQFVQSVVLLYAYAEGHAIRTGSEAVKVQGSQQSLCQCTLFYICHL
jgi:hypothetical protein